MIRRYLWIILLLVAVPCYALNPFQAFMMSAGAAGAASACSSSLVGNSATDGTCGDLASTAMYCTLQTPSCTGCSSGTLGYGHINHGNTDVDTVKICVYTEGDADTATDADDVPVTSMTCQTATSGAATGWVQTGSKLGGTVSCGSSFWVCAIPDSTNFNVCRVDTGGTSYYGVNAGWYGSPPATLANVTTSSARIWDIYVDIE